MCAQWHCQVLAMVHLVVVVNLPRSEEKTTVNLPRKGKKG
jgi:hypothetical protein